MIDVSLPADRTWTMMRVAALLTPYYAADVPQSIIAIDAEDWAEALHGYPEWAITKACRWWKGSSNDNRRRKPLEGDIAERCRLEMGIVRVAENALKRGVGISSQEQGHFEPVRERVSPERYAEMMAELPKYMRPKKFGAEGAA